MKTLNFTANDELKRLGKGKISEVVSSNGEWVSKLSDKELQKLGALTIKNNLDNEIELEFIDEDEGEIPVYKVDKVAKFIFLTYQSGIFDSSRSYEYTRNTLMDIEKFEERFGTSAFMFNEDQVIETIKELGKRSKFYGIKARIKVLNDYFNFYAKEFGLKKSDNQWSKYYTTKKLEVVLEVNQKVVNLKREDLINLFNHMTNPQQGIIPILLFEGLALSSSDDKDDIRFLKMDNIDRDSVFLKARTKEVDDRGFRLSVDRKIQLDEDVMNCIVKTMTTDSMVRISHYDLEVKKLMDTPYLLRGIEGRRRKRDTGLEFSYSAAYDRLIECQKNYEELNVEIDDFSSKYIANCGKSYYIFKLMDEGKTETEAIIEVLQRFGDWNTVGDIDKDVKLDTNKNRMARLRRSYKLYQ